MDESPQPPELLVSAYYMLSFTCGLFVTMALMIASVVAIVYFGLDSTHEDVSAALYFGPLLLVTIPAAIHLLWRKRCGQFACVCVGELLAFVIATIVYLEFSSPYA